MAEVKSSTMPGLQSEDENIAEVQAGDEANGSTSEVKPEVENEVDASEKTAKKENVPPKRPGTTTAAVRRPGSSSSTKPTTSSAASATPRPSMGGLSKPPTRPAAGASVRKATSSATGPTSASVGHRSQASTGGSGDEKKKSLAAGTARRSSMAPAATGTYHGAPDSTGSAAEKRSSMASSTTRKPPLSASVGSPTTKTIGRGLGASTGTKPPTLSSSTTRSTPISKTVGGNVSDTKKKLAPIAGSPSTVKTSTPARSGGTGVASSKEVDDLKTKLADSESRVEALQKEMADAQEQKLELQKSIEVEADRVMEAEESIKATHRQMVEKHQSEIESLQVKLEEAEIARKNAHEESLKAVQEAEQAAASKGAVEAAEALEKVKREHAAALESSNTEIEKAKDVSGSSLRVVDEKEAEILNLKTQLEKEFEIARSQSEAMKTLQTEHDIRGDRLQKLQAESETESLQHKDSLDALRSSLESQQRAAIDLLKSSHAAEVAKGSTEATSSHEAEVEELTRVHTSSISDLQKQLEEAIATHESVESKHKGQVAALEAEVSKLAQGSAKNAQALSTSVKELEDLRASSGSAQADLVTAQTQISDMERRHAEDEAKIAKVDAHVITLQHEMAESKAELSKTQKELTSFQKMLDTFGEESKTKDEAHNKIDAELITVKKNLEDRISLVSNLEEKHKSELQTISKDYEREIDALRGESGVKEELNELKIKHEDLSKQHDQVISSHASEVEGWTRRHAEATAENATLLQTNQDEIKTMQDSHIRGLNEIREQAASTGNTAHTAELEKLQAGYANELDALRNGHSESLATAASDVEKYKSELDALRGQVSQSSTALDNASEELNSLKQALAAEKMARTTAEASLDAALTKKPDTSEIDSVRHELQTLKDQHQAALMTAQQESAQVTEEHLRTKSNLEAAEKELEMEKSKAEQSKQTGVADYKDMHEAMQQLVEEANHKSAELEAKLKEAEAILQVKEKELVEVTTKNRPSGLASSMFAPKTLDSPSSDLATSPKTPKTPEAKAKVTAQQLQSMNEDMKLDNLRALGAISGSSPNAES